MAEFCRDCSIHLFGEDIRENHFEGLCKEDEITNILCEGCGEQIWVDFKGNRVYLCQVCGKVTYKRNWNSYYLACDDCVDNSGRR